MNGGDVTDAFIFLVLAFLDLLFLMHLRRKRLRQVGTKRVMRSLRAHLGRMNPAGVAVRQGKGAVA